MDWIPEFIKELFLQYWEVLKKGIVWFFDRLIDFANWVFPKMQEIGNSIVSQVIDFLVFHFPPLDGVAGHHTTLATINFFFPLGELVSLALALGTVHLVVWGYRLVKSWVPSVSS